MPNKDCRNLALEDALRALPVFTVLEPKRLTELARHCRMLALAAQDVLFQPGEPIVHAHFLLSGTIHRSAPLYGHTEKLLELVRAGQMVAAAEVFADDAARYASQARATDDSSVLAIERSGLLALAAQHADLSLALVRMLAQRQRAAEFEVVSHHTLSGAQRVLEYLLHLAGDRRHLAGETTVELDATKRTLAARLDMTPETFSRALLQLSQEGVIVVDGSTIHLQNAMLARHDAAESLPSRRPQRFQTNGRGTVKANLISVALVNQCGRHRLLSQRLAVFWGMVARRIASETARANLRRLVEQFERNIALVAASPLPANLPPLLAALQQDWADYRTLLTVSAPSHEVGQFVFEQSEKILVAADALAMAAGEAFAPAGRLVNVAGRNRMLTGRTAKLYLFRDWEVCQEQASTLIEAAREEFARNMDYLKTHGPTSPEVLAQLAIDADEWQRFLALIDVQPEKRSAGAHLRNLIKVSEKLLRHVDTTVKLYELLVDEAAAGAELAN